MAVATPTRSASGGMVAIVAGWITASVALLLVTIGGLALWGDARKDADGYLSTSQHRIETTTYALSTDDVGLDVVNPVLSGDGFGRLRLRAESRDGEPVFVGIARTGDVDAYLGRTRHTRLAELDFDPFDAARRDYDGARPARPAEQSFWVASAHGAGARTLVWDARDGNWSVVVMNEDASAGVDADVEAGATLTFLEPFGYGMLAIGLIVLAAGAALIADGVKARRRR